MTKTRRKFTQEERFAKRCRRSKVTIGKVELDAKAGILYGEVVGIRDVVTFQGKSVQEVEQAFRESVNNYLAFCRTAGNNRKNPGWQTQGVTGGVAVVGRSGPLARC